MIKFQGIYGNHGILEHISFAWDTILCFCINAALSLVSLQRCYNDNVTTIYTVECVPC